MRVEISHADAYGREERPQFRGPLHKEEWEFETRSGTTECVVSWVAEVSTLECVLERCPGDEFVVARADHRHHPDADYVVEIPERPNR